ncbi:MAG TPA: SDR family oxidoreductase [Terriglobia bacterium]|nr:SDR family oxidoreductase [Terriglobia bacterium]
MTEAGQSFNQTEILLTGANGFLGKVILGFLLDRYPEFKCLHILLRPRGELSAAARFQSEVMASPPLRAIAGRASGDLLEKKINIISGDISSRECGIGANDLEKLSGVGLIINCAGKVDFFPPLDDSFASNVDGVENVIALARRCAAKLLHVSTCFVCGEADGLIEESDPISGYYPHRRGAEDQSFDYREELRHARETARQIYESDGGDKQRRSRELSQRLIALGRQRAAGWGWVNTYTYSKSLGEQLIASADGIEYAIVRPAIVESSWQFPFPGWIEGGRTAAPLVLMALGGQKDWPINEDAPLEVVPVDMVAAAILTVAALLLNECHERVYQLGSADINPVNLGSIVRWLDGEARRRKNGNGSIGKALMDWLAGARRGAKVCFVTEEEAEARRAIREKRAARLERRVAALTSIAGKAGLPGKQMLQGLGGELRKLGLQSKFRDQTLDQYLPFVLQNRYVFESENIRAAHSSLPEADRKLLPWCPEEIDWKDYWIRNQIGGIEKWVQPEAVRDWTFKI